MNQDKTENPKILGQNPAATLQNSQPLTSTFLPKSPQIIFIPNLGLSREFQLIITPTERGKSTLTQNKYQLYVSLYSHRNYVHPNFLTFVTLPQLTFHQKFYPLALLTNSHIDLRSLSRRLKSKRGSRQSNKSRFFRISSQVRISWSQVLDFRIVLDTDHIRTCFLTTLKPICRPLRVRTLNLAVKAGLLRLKRPTIDRFSRCL